MDDKMDLAEAQKQGKLSNWKRKGKLSELDRLKKRQKELQIMKLSQEWDARRHKRKMDRIQWLQQRKDQVTTHGDSTEPVKTTDDVQEQRANIPGGKTNNSLLLSYSTQQNVYESPKELPIKTISNIHADRQEENEKDFCKVSPSSESSVCSPPSTNQVYKSVVVKTERLDSERFSNSNFTTTVSRQSHSRTSGHVPVDVRKRRKKNDGLGIRNRTSEERQDFRSALQTGSMLGSKLGSSAYESLVNLVNSQPALDDIKNQSASSVIAQAMKQSGLDDDEIEEEEDEDEPSLLMASEPVRFEDVLQGGGTNIQRLPTHSVDLMSSHGKQQDVSEVHSHSRPQSRNTISEPRPTRKDEDISSYPKIKQCYSLTGEDSKTSSPLPSPASNHTASPIASNACPTSDCSTTKMEVDRHPNVTQPSSSSQSCPPSGYLVPVYKPSADEVVYAFVPRTGDRPHPGHLRSSDTIKTSPQNAGYTTIDERMRHGGYSLVRPPTAIIHHGRNTSLDRTEPYPTIYQQTIDRVQYKTTHQPASVTHQPASVTHQPASVTHQPASITHQPASVAHQLISVTHHSTRVTHHPTSVTHHQTSVTHHPNSVTHHPTSITHHPNSVTHHNTNVTHHPTNVTWVNAHCISDKRSDHCKSHHIPHSAIREVPDGRVSLVNTHRHNTYHEQQEVIVKPRQTPTPVVTLANGYSPTHHNAPKLSNSDKNRPSSSPHSNPDTINNPTAVYVRPRLVPREIIVPYHAGSGNVPIVEYIKTDVICDKDLSNWTAQNVAEFISATDCSESAKIFIEQDIDGKAVLLLSQDIFVNRLNLKLGTAIKLYNHVANLRSALLM